MPLQIYPQRRASDTHWIGGWVGPRTDLEDMERRKTIYASVS
jgi:hypothetical protein